jgi:hypothetical protein
LAQAFALLLALSAVCGVTFLVGPAACDGRAGDDALGLDCSVGGVPFDEVHCPAAGYITNPGSCCDFALCGDGQPTYAVCQSGEYFGYCTCVNPSGSMECMGSDCLSGDATRSDSALVGDGQTGKDADLSDATATMDGGT